VHPDRRGKGAGKALLLSALHAMRAEGYGYAIVGWASSIAFYEQAVGAVVIEGSDPGIYPAKLLR
jgi:GNAT superfamily N-acetyltransferase